MNAVGRMLIEGLVDDRLPAFVAVRVRERFSTDASWAAHYHALRVAQRAAAGGASLSSGQMASLLAHVVDGAPTPARSAGKQIFALASAVACAAIFVVVGRAPSDALRPRGGHVASAGVHVRCVDAARAHVLGEADVADGAHLVCVTGGLLAFSATNTTDGALYVTGVAVDDTADNASLFELPFAGDAPLRVDPGSVDTPLPKGFALDATPRRIHVTAQLVSDAHAPRSPPSQGSAALLVDVRAP